MPGTQTVGSRPERPRIRLAPGLALVIGLFCPVPSPAQSAADSTVVRSLAELHQLVNAYRLGAGCEALRWHEGTASVAEAHSRDMSRRNYFDHVTPEGTDVHRRLLAGGVTWQGSIAENIALTVRGPDLVIELWMDSPPHRANLLDCSFTHHGLGLFRDRWTQVLIERPQG